MSAISQDTYAIQGIPLTGVGGGGASFNSTFSTIYVANEVITTTLASALTSTIILEAEEAFVSSLSSFFINAVDIGCSSISTLGVVLDGNILTSVGNELLLNGIPIATNSSLSSIADWAIDPAISTLQMNNNPIIGSVGYTGTGTVSTTDIQAVTGYISTLVCSDISTITLTVQSTIHSISSISSLVVAADALFVSSINGGQYPPSGTSSFETTSVSSLTASSINGISYPPPNSDVSQWARFPAVSTITGGVGATDDLSIVVGRNLAINSRVSTGVVVDRGSDVGGFASFNVVAQNGNRGQINLTANPGFAGINGEVNITANGGTTPGLIGSGGLIQLTANTPIGTDPALTSAIKFSAAGINSYAGAVPSFGSLLGYNFIYGTLGVNLCAGLPSALPNVPGTTYLYGTTGITLGSQTNTASDITQSAGGLYTTLVTGYWPGGVYSPSNLVIRGRQIPVYGNSYVQLSNVDVLSFDSGASKAITGLSTINGVSYPPVAASIPANLVVSTLTAANQVSTPALFVSSVNGNVYPPVFEPPANAIVSSLTAADYVSTAKIYGLSTLYGQSVTNNIVFNPDGGLTFNNDGGDMIVDNAGSLTVRTDLIIPAYSLYVSSILGVSSINGSAYPAVFEPPADAVVSTLTAANSVSTPALFVSSVNGAAYPSAASVPADLVVSSLTAATSVVTFALNADIINGNAANTPIVSSLTSQSVSTSALFVSSVNNAAYPPAFVPPTNLIVSTLAVSSFVSTLALTVSSINGNTTSDPTVSTLTVAGLGNITLQGHPGTTTSASIFFKTGNETVNEGILSVQKSESYTDPSTRAYTGFAVTAFSTLGALQPVICGSVLLNPTPNVFTGAPITGNTAGDVIFPMSSIIGISTINGIAYPTATAGIQSTIANAGSFVDIDGGNISSFSGGRTSIVANAGGVYILDSDNNASINVLSDITMTPTSGGSVIINQAPLYVSSIFISSVNGALYPPPSAGGSPNAEFSTVTVSSFVSTRQLSNLSSINNIIQIGSFGELVAYQMAATNGANFAGNVQIPQLTSVSSINSGIRLTTNTIATNLMSTFTLNAIEIANLSTINGAPYMPSTFTEASISSLTVSTINGNQVQGPVWASGGTYSNPNVTFTANTNTLISYTSTTTTTSTAKNMIFATFEATTTATGTIYMTIARSVIPPTAASSFNLTNGTSALTNAINGNGLSMWGSAFNTSRLTAYASVVDTPGAPGTYYYSVWGYDTAAVTNTASELTCLTVLNVAP